MSPPRPVHLEDHAVMITLFGKAPGEGVARVRFWPAGARTVRTLKGLGACWGLAVVTIFIPVAHFLLVPGFLVGGLVLAARWAGQERTYAETHGRCPACGQEERFAVRGKFLLPRETSCDGCGARVILKSPAAAGRQQTDEEAVRGGRLKGMGPSEI